MSSPRMRRVDEAIREVIGDLLARELKDPRVGFVTVTDVRTSPDMSHARVWVSTIEPTGGAAGPQRRESALAGLQSAHGYIQRRLADELSLKRTPVLAFVYDDTSERALRLGALIDASARAGASPGEERGEERGGGYSEGAGDIGGEGQR